MTAEIQQALEHWKQLCDSALQHWPAFSETELNAVPQPGKWCRKEVLGHLIDSAANNHQRFVRIGFEDRPVIFYDQEQWNRFSYHTSMDSERLIAFWYQYNLHLIELVQRIPEALYQREGVGRNGFPQTLHYYITDYVAHLEHHLIQIFGPGKL